MSIEKINGRYVPTCDTCGETLDPVFTFDEAREQMAENEWQTEKIKGEWVNFCPDCQ